MFKIPLQEIHCSYIILDHHNSNKKAFDLYGVDVSVCHNVSIELDIMTIS